MGARIGAKAGFDLTWPFGTAARLETRVPEPPRFEGKRFASIEAALADGPKFFEELMAAVGSRDGREIVRALDAPARRKPRSIATPKGAISSNPNSAVTRKRNKREKRMSFVLRRTLLACLATLGAVRRRRAQAQEVTVKVGAVSSISTVAILWAIEKGYFKEYGIKVVDRKPRHLRQRRSRCWRKTSCRSSRAAFRPAISTPWRRTCRSPW